MSEQKKRPTIEELERILADPTPRKIEVRPDGSIYADLEAGRKEWNRQQDVITDLRSQLATEKQAAITIAAQCLSTGLVPQGVEGTVEAVKAVCATVSKLQADLGLALRERNDADRLRTTYFEQVHNLEAKLADSEKWVKARADMDIDLCRLQLPDGTVPTNTISCARAWHQWAKHYWQELAKEQELNKALRKTSDPDLQWTALVQRKQWLEQELAKVQRQRDELRDQFNSARKEWERDEQNLVNELNAKVDLKQLKDLQQALEKEEGMGECLAMVAETLSHLGCCHDKDTHKATPPMMYPEWIMCVLKHHTKLASESLNECVTILRCFGTDYLPAINRAIKASKAHQSQERRVGEATQPTPEGGNV